MRKHKITYGKTGWEIYIHIHLLVLLDPEPGTPSHSGQDCKSLDTFKSLLKTHLFNISYDEWLLF